MRIDLPAKEKVYRQNKGLLVSLHIDAWLLLGILGLIVIGSLIVFSASGADPEVLSRHLLRVGFAFA